MPETKAKPTGKTAHPTARQEFLRGVVEVIPLLLGMIPFGLIYGVVAIEVGLPPAAAFALSFVIFAGSSQVVFIQLYGLGAGFAEIIGSSAMVNLRHTLYSASMADYLKNLELRWKLLLSYLLTDQAFVVSLNRFQHRPHAPHMHYHLLGTGLTLWIMWQIATLVGIFVGEIIPPALNLDFAIPLTFLALVATQIRSKPVLVSLVVAGVAALVLREVPYNLWLIGGALCGMAAGYCAEKFFFPADKVQIDSIEDEERPEA